MATRGFGIAGALDRAIIAELATAVEATGYATFWANDTEEGDGLDAVRVAFEASRSLRFGVGVIPVDRVSPAEIARRVKAYGLPEDRLTIGIGSGGLKQGALAAVEEAATQLRGLTEARVVVGALGPKMVALSGKASDGVLLNWLTPEYAATLTDLCRTASQNAWVAAYVRVGLSGKGQERVVAEGARYATYPAYKSHFDRMHVDPPETCALGDAAAIQTRLATFDASGVDETVVRAIAGHETVEDYLSVLMAAVPHE
jgi:alkanesulfonate monooxygenase SsuD/methylene tetrahydromethanopterin reductase-like flavin-dependent oxidoreductase (luciferase family)